MCLSAWLRWPDMLYVNQVSCEFLPQRALAKPPRERFIVYQRDLHRIAEDTLSEETLVQGDQYSFTELGDAVLEEMAQNGEIDGVDLTIFSYWTPEFDPEYSAFGPYFMEQYKLNGHSFDICDNGSLASATALHIADSYFLSGKASKILLLGMEQNTIGRNLKKGLPIPERSCAIAAVLSAERRRDSKWQVTATGQIGEWDVVSGIKAMDFITQCAEQHNLAQGQLVLLTQRNATFYKTLRFELDTQNRDPGLVYAFLSPGVTGMNTLLTLADETLSDLKGKTVLLVDHDMESLRISWSLLTSLEEEDCV